MTKLLEKTFLMLQFTKTQCIVLAQCHVFRSDAPGGVGDTKGESFLSCRGQVNIFGGSVVA